MNKSEQPDLPGFNESNKDENISGLDKENPELDDEKARRERFIRDLAKRKGVSVDELKNQERDDPWEDIGGSK